MKKIDIALLGFGTVGRGTYHVLSENAKLIEARFGVHINVKKILEINSLVVRASGLPKRTFTTDYNDILDDPSIKVVVEVMGGLEPAGTFIRKALQAKKHVVSSNKAVLAENITEFKSLAKENGVSLYYEASVCGAIPVLSSIRGNLAANRFVEIRGIVNGTSNYILTQMTENSMRYEAALSKAQELGFAELNPTADVEGIDAANKICLLADMAMGYYQKPSTVKRVGITEITAEDIEDAKEKNCKIKLIAKAKLGKSGVILTVKPELIKSTDQLYNVDYEFNGISLKTDCADEVFFYGRGAGSIPTGSAVAGDVLTVAIQVALEKPSRKPASKPAENPAEASKTRTAAKKGASTSTKTEAAKKKETTAKKAAVTKTTATKKAVSKTAAKKSALTAKKTVATKKAAVTKAAASKATAKKQTRKK